MMIPRIQHSSSLCRTDCAGDKETIRHRCWPRPSDVPAETGSLGVSVRHSACLVRSPSSGGTSSRPGEAWQAAYVIAQRQGVPLGPYLADLARCMRPRRRSAGKGTHHGSPGTWWQDVALAAVEVFTALGELAEARRHVDAAYREAWADGLPYAYATSSGASGQRSRRWGCRSHSLPPFDPASVAQLPYEADIRAFIDELKQEKGTMPTRSSRQRIHYRRRAQMGTHSAAGGVPGGSFGHSARALAESW